MIYGTIHTELKVHQVALILKAGGPSSVKNHRPISLLSNISSRSVNFMAALHSGLFYKGILVVGKTVYPVQHDKNS